MKRRRTIFAGMLVGLLGLLMLPGLAAAIGTEAGTAITNFATGTYTDANSNTYAPVVTASVTTLVSQVGGITLTPVTASHTGSADKESYYPFILTNTGNGNDTFTMSYTLDTTGTSSWTVRLCQDTNGNGVLDSTEYNALTNTCTVNVTSVSLGSDDHAYVVAVVIPGAEADNGDVGVLSGTATSTFDSSQFVAGVYTTTISAAVLNLTKSVSPANPKPGDTVTYTITYTNSGSSPGYQVVINDVVPTGVTYVSESIRLNTLVKTDAADSDEAEEVVAGGITTVKITFPNPIPIETTGTVIFQATVNAALPEFTEIVNTASITYNATDGVPGTSSTNNSQNSTITVAQNVSVLVAPETVTTNQLPGDLNVHAFTVTNTSNGNDTYNLSSLGLYWTWTIYNDVNRDGKYDAGDTLVIDTGTDQIIDTGDMQAGQTKYFVATTTVTGTNGQIGQHTVTATSITDATVTDTSIKYTNIQTPVITMSKAVAPVGNQPPGTELTYTITVRNTGSRPAAGFFITDILSPYLTYTPGSIRVAGAVVTDAQDTDQGYFDSGSRTVFISIASISAGATFDIVFKATIK